MSELPPASGPPRVIAIGREDSPCALLLTESNSVVWHELTVAPSRKAGVSVGAVPPSSVPEISRFYDFFIHRDLSRCKLSFANRCKPSTAKNNLLATIKFALMQSPLALDIACGGQLMSQQIRVGNLEINIAHIAPALICGTVALASFSNAAKADEGGVSCHIHDFAGSALS
jgi:hypothetical protein